MKKDEYMNRMKLALRDVSVDWHDQKYQHVLEQIEQQVDQGFAPGPDFHAGIAFTLICFNKGLEMFTGLNTLPVNLPDDSPASDRNLLAPQVPTDESGLGKRVMALLNEEQRRYLAPASWHAEHGETHIGLFFPDSHEAHASRVAQHPTELMSALYEIVGADYDVMIFVGEEAKSIFTANTGDFFA